MSKAIVDDLLLKRHTELTEAFEQIYGGITSQTFQSTLQEMMQPLNQVEEDELKELKKEHESKTKQAKLNVFKSMHTNLRQLVIDSLEWKEYPQKMNSTTIEKDTRLKELESRHKYGTVGQFLSFDSGTAATFARADHQHAFNFNVIPDDILIEDLKQAHMEASLEEEMLNNGSNT